MSTLPRRTSSGGRRAAATTTALALVLAGLVLGPERASAQECEPNPVACENAKPGQPSSEWDIIGTGDPSIQGFATDISVNRGEQIDFKIATSATAYSIRIYRLGWYGGNGARRVATIAPSVPLPQQQPLPCVDEPDTQLYDCGGWAVSASWQVPADAVSGVYIARLQRTDSANGGASHITFVVRDDSSTSDLLVKTSDATWHAYNTYGGANFYQAPVNGRAYQVSYNRPFSTRGANGRDFLFSAEYPMIRFLERNGYDISYTTDVDTHRRGQLIRNHRVFLSVGHDEYWTGQERAYVEAARDAGVHLAFFSGNEVYWRTRLAPSQDGRGTPNRTLVCYKETWANGKIDPAAEWTGTWRDPRFATPAEGANRPENALTGTAYMSNNTDLAVKVPYAQSRYRIWRNTSVATLAPGQTATLAPHTIGYESNEDLDNGFRPPGLIRLSTTTGPTPQYLRDFGNVVTPGTTTHHLTLYRAASGALVFSAGSIQWSWGLDNEHDGTAEPADPRMQQATINLLADMNSQPTTLMTGLTAPTPSTDTLPPAAAITAPAAGTTVTNGAAVTLTGTATDAGGGRVAGVEVSTDDGDTWHPADGTDTWTYRIYSSGTTSQTVLVRAMDDSANIQDPPSTVSLRLTGPSTIFGNRVPQNPAVDDPTPVELGVRFIPEHDGYITGVRFYKGTGNTGTHTGSLWTTTGTRLATATFTNETTTGWQKLTFPNPIPITAQTPYIASYTAPNGHYPADPLTFSSHNIDSSPLIAPQSTPTARNGVYALYSGFPSWSYDDTNYYVDVTFVDSVAGAPSPIAVSPPSGAVSVPVTVTPSVTWSRALSLPSIQFTLTNPAGTQVPGTTSYDAATRRVTFVPSAPLAASTTYTANVMVSDTLGNPADAPMVWPFTTDAYTTVHTLLPAGLTPQHVAVDDPSRTELGVKFIPAVNGRVIGVRFYQGPGNTGTHTGSLWNMSGTRLATATFAGETGSGWQQVRFANPVSVTAGTTYVASYHAPNGYYSATYDFFTTPLNNPPLSTPVTTSNGVYRYGSSAFPNTSWHATNYFVEPLFVVGTGS